jgi:hypothetical protein
MKPDDVILILRYLGKLPDKIRRMQAEIDGLDILYNPMRGAPLNFSPKGGAPGNSTAATAEKVIELDVAARMAECTVWIEVWRADERAIKAQLDRMDNRYKAILAGRYIYGPNGRRKKWAQLSGEVHWSEGTLKRKLPYALVRLGEMLDGVPMIEEILARAKDARD